MSAVMWTWRGRLTVVCVCLLSCAGGCAAPLQGPLTAQFVKAGEPSFSFDSEEPAAVPKPSPSPSKDEAEQLRSVASQRVVNSSGETIETNDRGLSAALRAADAAPTAANLRAVAESYRRLGVLDLAFDYLTKAAAGDPKDARIFEERAQVWREWKLPQRGLADAHRAVYLAPTSASAHSTLGTILQAIGDPRSARVEFEKALGFDSRAAYAMNNLCYLSILEGRTEQAQIECERAIAMEPQSATARNNLALSYAASGQFERARVEFLRTGDYVTATFNLGIAYMAAREYALAAEAFREVDYRRPSLKRAHGLARRASALAASSE